MKKAFQSLEEFEALRDEEKIDVTATRCMLDSLSFQTLVGMLSYFTALRQLRIRQWGKELRKITGQPIKIRMTREEITPYMQEDGVICFCKKDVHRVDRLFMLFAHETAHFILMQDKNYATIKKLDGVYTTLPEREQKMNSPIERCANLITLMILERCKGVEKGRRKTEKIERCIKTLQKQLTN